MEPWLLPEDTIQEPKNNITDPEAGGSSKESPLVSQGKSMDQIRRGSVKGDVV
jgi:hypothetical protein